MRRILAFLALVVAVLLGGRTVRADRGQIYVVEHPSSMAEGKLRIAVTYTLWVPDGVTTLRGLIVHQHGAGIIAANSGATAAFDLHWQALARKWSCALLAPSYHVQNEATDTTAGGSEWWFDPRRGSDQAFLTCLQEFADRTHHPEITAVPWVLWGHSAGGAWADMMTSLHPTRVVAVWLRSGSAAVFRSHVSMAPLAVPQEVYGIPFMCNSGLKEKGDSKYGKVWDGVVTTFEEYRAKGGLIGFAPDPKTKHETGDSRYLAIPYLDCCLAARLPDPGTDSQTLKPMPIDDAYLAPLFGTAAVPFNVYSGEPLKAVWLPNSTLAKDWQEYVKVGSVGDTTPPPAPYDVVAVRKDDGNLITWNADADFESGIGTFIILRDGRELARLPKHAPKKSFGRPLFQAMSFHDTPMSPLPQMAYLDKTTKTGSGHEYSVVEVNSVGLSSVPSPEASIPDLPVSR